MSEDRVNQTVVNKQTTRKKKFVPAILVVLVIGLIASLVLGFLYMGIKKPNQRVVVQASVCTGDSVIKKLNEYLSDITNNGDQDKAKQAIDYVTSQQDYASDPTCVEALSLFYYVNRDFKDFAGQIDKLEGFADKGQYPSPQFDGLRSTASKVADYESLTGRTR